MEIFLAIVIGAAFGAVLDRIGATNPTLIGKMLNLANLHLMKTILLAIGTASILMFGGQMLGLVDVGHMSVKTAYVGVFIGGLMLGLGWAASGYCPGTGVCAAASGRKDALFFIAGGLLGAAAYMATYPMWKASGLLSGSALTLGQVPGSKYDALLPGVPGDVAGIVMGAAFVLIAFLLPPSLTGRSKVAAPAE
ncbi:YeeE/YedE thiosulfate transporter family protein [Actibacterium ureilyticum]|uniref:YeeE/YedE thiosulfate transporter family protein n=1 Tax=Actibacterium ureilyticum TaxID=1590614 RepID=UPI000BAAF68F|nr:YeeE/YedE thiosulfate transporter family protein [Actibacterium ureilyticum]